MSGPLGSWTPWGLGQAVELGSGTVTPRKDGTSEFANAQQVSAKVCPGRFVHYMILDYKGWDEPDWSEKAVEQMNDAHRRGAAGLKEFKRLGLVLRDGKGKLIKVDDPKLDPVWQRCGELGMPVSIHVGDPQAFWEPRDEKNERWDELRDHPGWWFGDPKKFPPRMEILAALERVIERHPKTTFVCVHFGNNPEDVDWVDRQLDAHPNMNDRPGGADTRDRSRRHREVAQVFREAPGPHFLRHGFPGVVESDLGLVGRRRAADRSRRRRVFSEVLSLSGDGRSRLGAHDADPGQMDDQQHQHSGGSAAQGVFRQCAEALGAVRYRRQSCGRKRSTSTLSPMAS